MKLYHFTAIELLPNILASGLSRGDVPTGVRTGTNAVWLTTDPDPSGHGLSGGKVLSASDRWAYEQVSGRPLPDVEIRELNKRAIRITVMIASVNRKLVHWPKWAKSRVEPKFYSVLNETGGNKANSWYLFFGEIPAAKFRAVEQMDGRAD